MKRWTGPFNLAVLLKSKEDYLNIFLKNPLPSSLKVFRYVTISSENPFNRLRNIAIRHTTTSHYWVMDMDMWPSQDAYKTLMSLDDQ